MKLARTISGFTMVEVMLVLGVTGLLLVGVLGTSFSGIFAQRYTDSVRSFAEYIGSIYDEVSNPATFGAGNSKNYAIYGKAITFRPVGGITEVYSATLIGSAKIPGSTSDTFINELATVQAQLYCGQNIAGSSGSFGDTTVQKYTPLWQAELRQINNPAQGLSTEQPFSGTIIIARAPTSGTIHTIYTTADYNFAEGCDASAGQMSASNTLRDNLSSFASNPHADPAFKFQDISICVKGDHIETMREIRIAKDGRNTSAISTINTDVEDVYQEATLNGEREIITLGNQCK